MSHRESAPAREQRVGQTSAPRGDLFSHPPQAEALDQPLPPASVSTGGRCRSPPVNAATSPWTISLSRDTGGNPRAFSIDDIQSAADPTGS